MNSWIPRYYSATILKLAGFTSNSQAIWLAAVVAFFNFFGSCIGLYFVDRMGRRSLTIYSQISTVLCLACLSLCFYLAQQTSPELIRSQDNYAYNDHCNNYQYCFDCVQDDSCGYCSSLDSLPSSYHYSHSDSVHICMKGIGGNNQNPANQTICSKSNFYPDSCPGSDLVGWMIFMILCLYLLGFAPGMGPMPWCVNSEIYPTAFRGIGNSIATSVNWLANIFMSMTFLTIIDALTKQGAFFLYSCISLIFLIIFLIYLPETKHVPLEQIRYLFSDDVWGSYFCKKTTYAALLQDTKSEHNSPGEEIIDPTINRESGGTSDSGPGGIGRESLYGGSQQSKLSYQISYNGSLLPPVELFQSDSSHSMDNIAEKSWNQSKQQTQSGEILIETNSFDDNDAEESNLSTRKSLVIL